MRKIKGLWKILFGRTTILVVLLLFQIAVLEGGFYFLKQYIFLLNSVLGIVSLIVLLYILNARQNSSFKITWILLILFTPFFGVFFYIYNRMQPGTRMIRNQINRSIRRQKPYLQQDPKVIKALKKASPQNAGLAAYIHNSGHFPVYKNSKVRYFPSGESNFEEMMFQLSKAEEFIFMEYFIVDKGFVWNEVLQLLTKKAKEGVEIRFMYDGTCALSLLPPGYQKELESRGIKCKVFSPIRPFLSTYQNNRDHRKVVVIDGKVAFTGGANLADEYINRIKRFGFWKDSAIMVEGEAVKSFTLMFLQMWDIWEEDNPTDVRLYLKTEPAPSKSGRKDGFVIPFGDSPYDDEYVGEKVYLDILNSAKDYVHIMTPYLILDDSVVSALSYAVKRGVEVKIIMPHIPDKAYAYMLARTHYADLLEAGVQIYEYTPGFVHAKVFTSDDVKAVVGTINLDFRSLYLHFECAVYLYKDPVIREIENDMQATLELCQKITLQDCSDYSLIKKFIGSLLRVVAPLM